MVVMFDRSKNYNLVIEFISYEVLTSEKLQIV